MAKDKKEIDDFPELMRHLTSQEPLERVYFFYGDDNFRVEQLLNAIVKKRFGEARPDPLCFECFRGNETDAKTALSAVRNVSMFGGLKVVIYKNLDKLKDEAWKLLAEYAASPAKACLVLSLNSKPDKRKKSITELMKSVRAANCTNLAAECFNEEDKFPIVRSYIAEEAKSIGLKIESDALDKLAQSLGPNRALIARSLEKLQLVETATITRQIVDDQIVDTRQRSVFELGNGVRERNLSKSLEALQVLIEQKQEPVTINAVISKPIRDLLQYKLCQEKRMSDTEIATAMGVQDWLLRKNIRPYAEKYTLSELKNLYKACYNTDRALKSSAIPAPIVLSKLLMMLAVK